MSVREFIRWALALDRCVICGWGFTWKDWKNRQRGDNGRVAHDASLNCNRWME